MTFYKPDFPLELGPPSPKHHQYQQYQHSTFCGQPRSYQHQHHHYHSDHHPAASLSFGDERSFADGGERVEWQVAHELRTTDWDELKELSAARPQHMDSRQLRYDHAEITADQGM